MSYDVFSGKATSAQTITEGRKTKLSMSIPAPTADGSEDRLVYVNVAVNWKITDKRNPNYYNQVANLRLNWMRVNDPDGETAYHDYTISPIRSSFLVTLIHWEKGKAHIGGYWEAELTSPHATTMVISNSRYCKGRQVRLA